MTGAVDRMAVGDAVARGVEVLTVRSLHPGQLGRSVRGVLGENFLQQFDVLIDNEQRSISLDASGALAARMAGERLPLELSGKLLGEATLHRPIVSASLPALDSRPLHFLLDSAANSVLLLPTSRRSLNSWTGPELHRVEVRGLEGAMHCVAWSDELRWGSARLRHVPVAACRDAAPDHADNDGSLPTLLFQRIFLCHRGRYVILTPTRRQQDEGLAQVAEERLLP